MIQGQINKVQISHKDLQGPNKKKESIRTYVRLTKA